MDAHSDGSQVIPDAQRGLLGLGLEPPAPIGAEGALAALAHAVDHDLSTPDHSAATVRAYADDWADFSAFCALHGLEALPGRPADRRALPQGPGGPPQPHAGRPR